MLKPRFLTLSFLVLGATISRILPHPWNFSPLGAIALFGGAYFSDKRLAVIVPLSAVFISDIFLGFYREWPFIYIGYVFMVFVGMRFLERKSMKRIASASLFGSFIFFLWTNFVTWGFGSLYSRDFQGLVACYIAAIPFFQRAVLGDLFFTLILFGTFAVLEKLNPALAEEPIKVS